MHDRVACHDNLQYRCIGRDLSSAFQGNEHERQVRPAIKTLHEPRCRSPSGVDGEIDGGFPRGQATRRAIRCTVLLR